MTPEQIAELRVILTEPATFYEGVAPAIVKALLSDRDALQAEVERLKIERRQDGVILSNVNDAIGRAGIHCAITFWEAIDQLAAELRDLRAVINSPRTDEFFMAVRNEAAHQVERWGSEHDAGKRAEDWFTLLFYLLGKGARSHFDGDIEKLKHHVVTCAAVCLNWLRNLNGENTKMRPGLPDKASEVEG